jgi:beta-lactamase superfamily II metal-dependent hydrolase
MATKKKTTPPPKATLKKADPMTAPDRGVKIRMYRQGLGDCFLLAFPTGSGNPFYLLIDCGVIVGQVEGRPNIRQVAQHIAESTDNRLDVIVATHQHWDHLSGFVDASDVFQKIDVGQVWLAWTENPADHVAKNLHEKRKKAKKALHLAAAHMATNRSLVNTMDAEFGAALENVLGFLGAASGDRTTEAALANLRKKAEPVFLGPASESFALGGVDGARVYVLGPPRDEKKIKSYNDKKSDPQTYRVAELTLATQTEFLAAAFDADRHEEDAIPRSPFDARHAIEKKSTRYAELRSQYFGGSDSWREISLDWLRSAATMALDLDNATNNTSLALAIELGPGGKVLLFPADAQVGNWLSWHDQDWKDANGNKVTAADLLSRTAFYKVGHHGSHNATLRQRGLELMTSDELIAFVPLDRATAKKKKWPMPWPKLYKHLTTAARSRIVCVDDKALPSGKNCPPTCTAAEWRKFQKRISGDDFYFEVTIA